MAGPRAGQWMGVEQDRDDYWVAVRAGDRPGALEAVRRIRAAGHTPLEIIEDVIVPVQERLGELWLSGGCTGAQEQLATSINEGIVHWLCSFAPAPDPARPLVLVACLDRHELPALVVSEGLLAAGYRTAFAGGDTDQHELLRQVLVRKPRALLVSASLTSSLAQVKQLLGHVRAIGIPVVVGGRAFGGDAARAEAVGATAYAESVEGVVALLGELPPRLPPQTPEPPTAADVEAAWLGEYRSEITPYVLRALAARHPARPAAAWWGELEGHVDHVLGCLAASLVTGDETIMIEVRDWLSRVLAARGAGPALVHDVWEVLAVPLRGHPLARVHLAGSAPIAGIADGGVADGLATSA